MNLHTQFSLRTFFAWVTFIALAFAAWRLTNIVPESREPFIALFAIIFLTFLRIGHTRVVIVCAVVAGSASAMAFWCVDYFLPFHPKDRMFYIVAYSAIVATSGALTGLLATLLLSIRDSIRKRRNRAVQQADSAENVSDDSTHRPARRKWPSWLRLPSFGFCCAASLLVCITFFAWIVIDAQYPLTVYAVRYSVGLQQFDPDPMVVAFGLWDMMWDGLRSWENLGPRLLLFAVLTIAAAVSCLLMLLEFVRRTNIGRMLLTLLAMCAWLSLWVSYGQLNDCAVMRRAKSALPRFELAANSLSQHWPIESGMLPEVGAIYAYPDLHPNYLLLPGPRGYPIREDFGYRIDRSDDGAIRFNLSGATDCQIEFHPDSSKPTSYSTKLSTNTALMREAIRLKEHWYLVRYGGP